MNTPAKRPESRTSSQGQGDQLNAIVRDRQLIVVSNRQPYRHDYAEGGDGLTIDRPTGGLTAGLNPVMQRVGGTWIAWGDGEADREVVDSRDCVSVPPDDPGYALRRIWLSEEDVRDYYRGFSNQVLWPICHSALTKMNGEPSYWQRYRAVNEQFADVVAEEANARPLVWFQDYHLALAPRMARFRLPDDALFLHFWHIPWPSWDTYRACPHGRELLWGLLANDVLGFHVPRYRTNFLQCVDAALGEAVVDYQAGEVRYQGNVTSVEAHPMGVPFNQVQRTMPGPGNDAAWSSFAAEHDIPRGRRLAVGVDRLDYTKGIVERLRALERLWEIDPSWREELTFVQIGTESRSEIPAYRAVQSRVADVVERVNQRFATDSWQPIVYVTDHVPQDQLYGLYRHADAALVTPLRDGMNLVALEYVAAQRNGDGVLVLSDQAGIHDEIGEHVVSIRPADIDGLTAGFEHALTMSPLECRRRMNHLQRWISANDLDAWLQANFQAAEAAQPKGDPSVSPV